MPSEKWATFLLMFSDVLLGREQKGRTHKHNNFLSYIKATIWTYEPEVWTSLYTRNLPLAPKSPSSKEPLYVKLLLSVYILHIELSLPKS